MSPRVVHDAKEAIEAIGGVKFVAEMFGFGTSTVYNWYQRGIPPEAHAKLSARLREAGVQYSDDLFRQYAIAKKPLPIARRRKRRKKHNGGR